MAKPVISGEQSTHVALIIAQQSHKFYMIADVTNFAWLQKKKQILTVDENMTIVATNNWGHIDEEHQPGQLHKVHW